MKFHRGKWQDFLLAYPDSTPIHEESTKGGRRPKDASLMDGCRGVGKEEILQFLTVQFHLPLYHKIVHYQISNPTVRYRIPPWHHNR